MKRVARVVRGLGALAVLLAVVVGVPVLLVDLGLVPDGVPSAGDVMSTLSARDDGQLLRGVLGAGAWISWFVFTMATATELWATTTARPSPRLPGLRVFQGPAATLVAAVVVGFSLSATVAAPFAAATHDRPPLPVAAAAAVQLRPVVQHTDPDPTVGGTERMVSGPHYVVQRRDTLWALAERHLGDPLRYVEIVALNRDVVGPDNRIAAGMSLALPQDATALPDQPSAGTDVVVEAGDSLWTIAQETTGDGGSWPVIWDANEGRTEPGGDVFTNPDLIRPGWTMTVPGTQQDPAPATVPADQAPQPPTPSPSTAPSDPAPPPTPTPAPTSSSAAARPTPATPTSTDADGPSEATSSADESLGALVAEAAGAVSVLGAVSLLALQRYRRRQFRHRRPGRLLPAVPTHLGTSERTLWARTGVDISWLDEALRGLVTGRSGSGIPDVVGVCATSDAITVVLAETVDEVPVPWSTDETGTRWTLLRSSDLGGRPARTGRGHAPYPALVAIGSTAAGEEWFIDLERVGVTTIAGDHQRAVDLLRYLAAELAHNRWSEMLQVAAVGIGSELTQLNPDRLALHAAGEAPAGEFGARLTERIAALEPQPAGALEARVSDLHADAWAPRVLLLGRHPAGSAEHLADQLSGAGQRVGMAMVVVDERATPDADMTIDAAGTLVVPVLGLRLAAHQLPSDEAAAMAQLLAHAAQVEAQSEPRDATHAGSEAGPRVPAVDGLVDSILPLPDAHYLVSAATTADDVRVLAPAATTVGRQSALDADPDLDRDMADWHNPGSRRPKLTLLGPVQVAASGKLPERNPRRQFYTEVVAYLATRPDGATSEQYATALWPDEPDVIGKTKVRQSISVVRTWLGADDAGADHLPSGLTAAAGGRYRVTGALVDADLFRRLRARGVTRGADGIADFGAALDLVRGRPFELPDLRARGVGGYGWLLDDGSRMDLELAAVIVDVAHVVATHHLGNGEPERAAAAALVALRSGTYEDVPLLDLVAACDALGNRAEAETYVARILANHDAEIEEDLPPRTAELLFRRHRRGPARPG